VGGASISLRPSACCLTFHREFICKPGSVLLRFDVGVYRLGKLSRHALDLLQALSRLPVLIVELLAQFVRVRSQGGLEALPLLSHVLFELAEESAPLVVLLRLFRAPSDVYRTYIIHYCAVPYDLVYLEEELCFFKEDFFSPGRHDLLIDICDDRDQEVEEDDGICEDGEEPERPNHKLRRQGQLAVRVHVEVAQRSPYDEEKVSQVANARRVRTLTFLLIRLEF